MPQVQETVTKGLKREFVITVPQQDVENNLTTRLEELGKKVKLPGFRPGKVPMPVLKQRFGAETRGEVLDRTISEASQKTLQDRNLRPAMEPKIELVSFAEGQDLEFKLAVEILPEITPADFASIKLERVTADVDDKAIEEAIKNRLVLAVEEERH